MDEACLGLCSNSSIPNCYLEHFRNPTTTKSELLNRASDHRNGVYFKILMVKWQMLDDALQLGSGNVSAVFFFDADVLLLQNPFMHFDYIKYDFRHQAENGDGCAAGVNGGQLYVRNTDAGRRFISNMMARAPDILGAGKHGRLDQEYVSEAVRKAGATSCALDKAMFVGSWCHNPASAACAHNVTSPLAGAVTFHAHGIGDEKAKMARLTDFLFAWESLANLSKQFIYLNSTWNNRPTMTNNQAKSPPSLLPPTPSTLTVELSGLLFAADKIAETTLRLSISPREFWESNGHIGQRSSQVLFYSKYAKNSSLICEIGFNAGHSAIVFLAAESRAKLLVFDLGTLQYSNVSSKFVQDVYPNRLSIVWGSSFDTVPKYFQDNSKVCDVFSVDGDHSEPGSFTDLSNALVATKKGGIILADDVSESFGVPKSWSKLIIEGKILELECGEGGLVGPLGYHKRWCAGRVLV